MGFPDSSAGKESTCNAGDSGLTGDPGSIPGSGRSPGEGIGYPVFLGVPCGPAGKEYACSASRPGFDPWVGKIPGEGKGYPPQYFGLEGFHGPYSPCGHKESNMTKQLSLSKVICNDI